jgi:hypothetical protein
MAQPTRRQGVVLILLALAMIAMLAGCSSGTNGTTQKASPTSGPRATATTKPRGNGTPPAGGTPSPSPTATPVLACGGTFTDIAVPANAVQTSHTATTGATTSCGYRIPQDLQTVDTFFKTQMGTGGWTMLGDDPEGPLGFAQTYFKAQRFATITLSQHASDTHSTDVTISVESAQ